MFKADAKNGQNLVVMCRKISEFDKKDNGKKIIFFVHGETLNRPD